jgi:hypothetical protein
MVIETSITANVAVLAIIVLAIVGGGNDAVVASLLGKALMLSPGSEVVGSKPTPLTKTHIPPQSPTRNAQTT